MKARFLDIIYVCASTGLTITAAVLSLGAFGIASLLHPYPRIGLTFLCSVVGASLIGWLWFNSRALFWWRWADLFWVGFAAAALLTQAMTIEGDNAQRSVDSAKSSLDAAFKEFADSGFEVDGDCMPPISSSDQPSWIKEILARDPPTSPSDVIVRERARWKELHLRSSAWIKESIEKLVREAQVTEEPWMSATFESCAVWYALWQRPFALHLYTRGPVHFEFPPNWVGIATPLQRDGEIWPVAEPSLFPALTAVLNQLRDRVGLVDEGALRDIALTIWTCETFPPRRAAPNTIQIFAAQGDTGALTLRKLEAADRARSRFCLAAASLVDAVTGLRKARDERARYETSALLGILPRSKLTSWYAFVAFFAGLRLGRTVAELRSDHSKLWNIPLR